MSLHADGNSPPGPAWAWLGHAHTTSHASCSSSLMSQVLHVCAYHTYMCVHTNMHTSGSLSVFPPSW